MKDKKDRKNKKIFLGVFFILGFILICTPIYYLVTRYYLYGPHNVYAKQAALHRIEVLYGQDCDLISTDYRIYTAEMESGAARIYEWTYTCRDEAGRTFEVYVKGAGSSNHILAGNTNASDYTTYVSDTYAQLRIEEYFGDTYDLSEYRQDKGGGLLAPRDYEFVYMNENAEDIAEILSDMYFAETEFSQEGTLSCIVYDEEKNEVFDYSHRRLRDALQHETMDITEQSVKAYIVREIHTEHERE